MRKQLCHDNKGIVKFETVEYTLWMVITLDYL